MVFFSEQTQERKEVENIVADRMEGTSLDHPGRQKKRTFGIKNSGGTKHINWRWISTITAGAFVLSILINVLSSTVLGKVQQFLIALLVLLVIISIGIVFDIIGVAVQAAEEKPFHSMAARKVRGAHHSISIIRNSEKVASFCNDVVGDIAGIISGTTVTVVLVFVVDMFGSQNEMGLSLLLTGLVSAVTIGGKALGKTFAMNNANTIVYLVGLLFSLLDFSRRK